ncbi:RcnB family protein [Euryhalocaulis caribicus]|uniref:RcnB family protein n=1 Tax=Euryhalocaulis caribicus TaxID=1161401 RepID=UPI0003A906AF|nr:RcnB family protein [Euryhalocaulis caribicus]
MKALKPILIVAGAGALLAAPAAAFADPSHCPPGHAKKGWCDRDARYDRDRYDRYDRDDYHEERRAYEKGFRDGIREGQYLRDDVDYRVIRDYQRYGYAPPPRGHYYAQVDGEVLLVQAATQLIVQALADQR